MVAELAQSVAVVGINRIEHNTNRDEKGHYELDGYYHSRDCERL